jgi:hypothetical protein
VERNYPPAILNPSLVLNFTYRAGQKFRINLPRLFKDPEDDILVHSMHLDQSKDVPDWLTFNPISLSLYG